MGKSIFTEHVPYMVQPTEDGLSTEVVFNYHFLKTFRRWLAGVVEVGDEFMSPRELVLLRDYNAYADETIIFVGDKLLVVEALDKWIVDELVGTTQTTVERDYEETHSWRNTEEREGKLWEEVY